MSRTYPIEHIADLLLVPADKIDECLADLRMALAAARLAMAVMPRPVNHRVALSRIDWHDDGKRETTAELGDGSTLQIRKDPR